MVPHSDKSHGRNCLLLFFYEHHLIKNGINWHRQRNFPFFFGMEHYTCRTLLTLCSLEEIQHVTTQVVQVHSVPFAKPVFYMGFFL